MNLRSRADLPWVEEGYYLPEYPTMAVRAYNGQWVLTARFMEDKVASTPEQISAVLGWAESNRTHFKREALKEE